jgi:hypothetical protein
VTAAKSVTFYSFDPEHVRQQAEKAGLRYEDVKDVVASYQQDFSDRLRAEFRRAPSKTDAPTSTPNK